MTVRAVGRQVTIDPRIVLRLIASEARSLPRPLRAWFAFLGLFLALGAAAALRALFPGDKGVGTTPTVEWGLLIVGYVFFAITTSGLCLASSLGTVFGIERFRPLEKRHAILAVLCLVTAFGIIAIDLHYPIRMVFGAAFNPSPSSPMWWMGVFYGMYLCFLLTEVWSMFFGHPRIHQLACVLSSCMAVIAPSTLGAVFGVLAARPFWHGPFTPLLMVASAFLSGTSLLGIVFYAVWRLRLVGFERAATLAIPAVRSLLAIGLVAVGLLVGRELVAGVLTSDLALARATNVLVAGPLAAPFWALRVVAGLVVPLAIVLTAAGRRAGWLAVAAGLSIVGVFVDRLTFVLAGQLAPTTAVSGIVSVPYASYAPSPVEVSILLAAAAFIAFAYTVAERYLDLGESDVHGTFPFESLVRLVRRPVTVEEGPPAVDATDDASAEAAADANPVVEVQAEVLS